jgi:hypothetical protein
VGSGFPGFSPNTVRRFIVHALLAFCGALRYSRAMLN